MNERGVSTTVNYTMTLGITTLLVMGLLISTGTYVEGHRERTERMELTVVGQQLIGTLTAADRMAQSVGDSGDFTVDRDLPETVARRSYSVSVSTTGTPNRYNVTLATDNVDVTLHVTTRTDVEPVQVMGGDVEIRYDGATGTLVIADA